MSPELKALFEPKSVVVLGASELKGEDSLYTTLFRLIAENISKFKGKVNIVDLSGKLEGSEKKTSKIPMDRDLAIVVLPKGLLDKNLPKLLTRRVRAMILASGDLEKKHEEMLSNLVKRKKLILLGPNSMGVINTANGLLAVPDRGPMPKKSHIAVISQDACAAATMLDRARLCHTGLSKLVCTGRGFGIGEADLLKYLAQDKETEAVCVYIRDVKGGREFVEAIKGMVEKKPVIVLMGSPEWEGVFQAALKQAGALQARDIEELFAGAEGLVKQPPMRGNRVAIVTGFTGQAMLATRYLLEEGLEIATPSEKSAKKITKKFQSVKIEKFVDIGPAAKADRYKFAIEQLLSDESVDGIMVINSLKSSLLTFEDLREIAGVAKKSKDKPVVNVVVGGEDYTVALGVLADMELPLYGDMVNAARALKMLRLRGKILEKVKPK